MKYLNKETNGITLSRIGLGAMRMADVQQGVDTIHAALDSGITYLNTGDFYGHGESELVIREALKTRKREDIFIAVKFGGMLTPDDRFYILHFITKWSTNSCASSSVNVPLAKSLST